MDSKPNRKRQNRLNIYLSDDEYRSFLDKVQESGLNMNDFCRQQFKNAKVIAAPPADFRRLIWELKRIGSNLDQVLFRLNSIGDYEKEDLKTCIGEIHDVIKLLYQTFKNPGGS